MYQFKPRVYKGVYVDCPYCPDGKLSSAARVIEKHIELCHKDKRKMSLIEWGLKFHNLYTRKPKRKIVKEPKKYEGMNLFSS